jgi:predicted ATPase
MREASLPGQVLGDQGENLSSALLEIVEDPQRKEAILDWLRALTPMDVQDLRFKEDLQRRVLVYLVESSGLEVSAYSASDGTLRFLALIAALLSSQDGSFFFFEEIDNGIHPTRLHVLLDVLEQASRQMGHQIVATTHNPQLVAFLSEKARQDAVLLYRREQSQSADAVRIMELPDIERILEKQDLGRLFASGWLEDAVECLADEEEEPKAISASGN